MSLIWPHAPSSIEEALVFTTDVRQTPEGEFADSHHAAMSKLTYVSVVQDAERAAAEYRYRNNPARVWYVPQWIDMLRLDLDTLSPSGADLDTLAGISNIAYADWRVGNQVLVWQDWNQWSVHEIASIGGSSLGVSDYFDPGVFNPGQVVVVPCTSCYADGSISFSEVFRATQMSVSFREIAENDLDPGTDIYGTPSGQSRQVFSDHVVVSQGIEGAVERPLEIFDTGYGRIAIEDLRDFTEKLRGFTLSTGDAATLWGWRQFLHQMRGRDGAFFLPSGRADLPLYQTYQSPWSTVYVTKTFLGTTDYDGLVIAIDTFGDGSDVVYKTVGTAAETVSGRISLPLTDSGNPPRPSANVTTAAGRISICDLVRFDADEIAIQHRLAGGGWFSTIATTVREVPA